MSYDFEARILELGVAQAFLARRPPPISDAAIERFEGKIGGRLPSDYRAFLQTYGGFRSEDGGVWPERPRICCLFTLGLVCPCVEPTPFGGQHSVVWFLPLDHVERLRDLSAIIPADMIPIAEGESSACTCLSVKGDNAGSVYSLDVEFRNRWPDDRFYQYPNLHPDIAEWVRKRRNGQLPRKKPGYEHLYLIADSFTAFMDRLERESYGDQ